MKNKTRISLRLVALTILLSVGFVALKASEEDDGGGSAAGCIINPDKEKAGRCMEVVEGGYRCIPAFTPWNCTSSN